MNGLALCSGIAGLELGLELVDPEYRTVGYVEREAYAAAVVVARMEDSTLGRAPVWDDVSTFDGRRWRGAVDLVAAGFPSQPFSAAGKRLGAADERHLWPHVLRVLVECEAPVLFFENVPGVIKALSEIDEGLAAAGFQGSIDYFSAAGVGAPHRRKRAFCLAYRDGEGRRVLGESIARFERGAHRHVVDGRDPDVGDADDARRGLEVPWSRPQGGDAARRADPTMGDPQRARLEERGRDDSRGSFPDPFPPGRDDCEGWIDWLERGGPPPGVPRGAPGLPARMERLRTTGNSVVPLVAARAFVALARHLLQA